MSPVCRRLKNRERTQKINRDLSAYLEKLTSALLQTPTEEGASAALRALA